MPAQRAFGPFVLDPERGALLRDGVALPLGQRALAVLAVLAERPGEAVPKSDLLARAWPGSFVEEGNLTVQIAALRKALGETVEGQSWIVTVPRLGYRLRSLERMAIIRSSSCSADRFVTESTRKCRQPPDRSTTSYLSSRRRSWRLGIRTLTSVRNFRPCIRSSFRTQRAIIGFAMS